MSDHPHSCAIWSDNLVSDKTLPLPMVINVDENLYVYAPRSDFSICLSGLPILLLEIISGSTQADRLRMMLQAACALRLGSVLRKLHKSPHHIVKAIYIDTVYTATEYTFFLEDGLHQHVQTVIFCVLSLPNNKILIMLSS